jgi:hypothetical protein
MFILVAFRHFPYSMDLRLTHTRTTWRNCCESRPDEILHDGLRHAHAWIESSELPATDRVANFLAAAASKVRLGCPLGSSLAAHLPRRLYGLLTYAWS